MDYSCIGIREVKHHRSAAHAATAALVGLIALANLHCLIAILCAIGVWLVHGVLFIADPDSTLVIAEVINASVDVVVDHPAGLQEGLFNVEVGLRGGLQEDQVVLLGKALAFLSAHLATAIQVGLVSYQHHHYVGVAILPHFYKPTGKVIECFFSCYVIDQQRTRSPSVVGPRYALEGFLSSSVPNL